MIRMSRMLLILALAFTSLPVLSHAQDDRDSGAVFVMTNAAAKNEIIAYKRHADGS